VLGCGLDSADTGEGPVAGPCEHDNEPSRAIKVEILLAERLSTSKKDSALWKNVNPRMPFSWRTY
jgi:hypothetical protein